MMNIKSIKSLQEELSTLIGVSGYEDDVSNFILKLIEKENLADKAWIDPLGNVLAIKEGKNKPYYLREGKSTHAYIRAADVNLPASKKALRTFINGSSGRQGHKKALKRDEKIAYDLFEQNKRLSISQIKKLLNYSDRRIKKIIVTLTKQGMIVPSYNEKKVFYRTEDK